MEKVFKIKMIFRPFASGISFAFKSLKTFSKEGNLVDSNDKDYIKIGSGQYAFVKQGESGCYFSKRTERRLNMVTYEFYLKNGSDEPNLIGILPERRKNRRRITRGSIMRWGHLVAGSYVDPKSVYFIQLVL